MSTIAAFTPTGGDASSQFLSQLRKRTSDLKWLFLAHADESLLDLLADAIDGPTSAVLPIAQSDWNFESSNSLQAVTFAIRQSKVQHIALVGHSEAILDDVNQPEASSSERHLGSQFLLEVKWSQQQIAAAKLHLAEQMEQLATIREVDLAVKANRLRLHALIYLAQSGAFLTYDPSSKLFFPVE